MPALREHLFQRRIGSDRLFRWRGGEVSRVEGLSDGVFALTLTLLVVSVDVPGTLYELWHTVRDLPVFLACFVLLMWAWSQHYLFFRRYGLEDLPTRVLNSVFLFLVLFYAYPTKFVATFLWRGVLGEPMEAMFATPPGVEWMSSYRQRATMMLFYGLGFVGVFGSLAAMSSWAYRRRDELELDELERFLTRGTVITHLLTAGVAAVSVALVLLGVQPGWSGVVYFALGPLHAVWGYWVGRRAAQLDAQLARAPSLVGSRGNSNDDASGSSSSA
ncbi:MAG: TMEM175 family protein [Planctomycetota bacterium]